MQDAPCAADDKSEWLIAAQLRVRPPGAAWETAMLVSNIGPGGNFGSYGMRAPTDKSDSVRLRTR